MTENEKSWDLFISHAWEDKQSFVRPLAEALNRLGVSVWYDEFSLRPGDSLSRSIDQGLSNSKYALVIISPHFIGKGWAEYELRGLINRDIREGRVILPVWHGVTAQEVARFSPPLADKFAFNTCELSAEELAIRIVREIRPDLYANHSRSELESLASGDAISELQDEIIRTREQLDEVKAQLADYRCRYCNAPLSARNHIAIDPEGKHEDVYEIFECGCSTLGGYVKRPCAAHPQFPKFNEYEVSSRRLDNGQWECQAWGRSRMAHQVLLFPCYGQTKEEAEQRMRESYERCARKRTWPS